MHKEGLVEINDESYRLIPESYPYPRGEIWARTIRNLTDAILDFVYHV